MTYLLPLSLAMVLGHSLAGGAAPKPSAPKPVPKNGQSQVQPAPKPVQTASSSQGLPRIEGALPDELNENQLTIAAMMFILSRNELANTPDGEEPWPCIEDTEQVVFLKGNNKATYEQFKAGMKAQNYKLTRELDSGVGHTTFEFSKGQGVYLGMWAEAYMGERSTLALCQRAAHWKPASAPAAPPPPAKAGNLTKLSGQVMDWKLGERLLSLMAKVNHNYYDENEEEADWEDEEATWPDHEWIGSGTITRSGQLNLVLPEGKTISKKVLFPITEALIQGWYGADEFADVTCNANPYRVSNDAQGLKLARIFVADAGAKFNKDALGNEKLTSMIYLTQEGLVKNRLHDSMMLFVYVDRAVTVKGQQVCQDEGGTPLSMDIDLNLSAGWNAVMEITPSLDNEEGLTQLRNAPANVRQPWSLADSY